MRTSVALALLCKSALLQPVTAAAVKWSSSTPGSIINIKALGLTYVTGLLHDRGASLNGRSNEAPNSNLSTTAPAADYTTSVSTTSSISPSLDSELSSAIASETQSSGNGTDVLSDPSWTWTTTRTSRPQSMETTSPATWTTVPMNLSSSSHTSTIPPTDWTSNSNAPTTLPTSSSATCTPWPTSDPGTVFEIIYTSTTTFYGNESDYQPPYDPIETPTYCQEPPVQMPAPDDPHHTFPINLPPPEESLSTEIGLPVITFTTTDRNPAVIFSPGPIPGYSQPGDYNHNPGNHDAPIEDPPPRTQPPPFTITADGDQVIINDSTYSGIGPGQVTTVIVDGGTFTISPTAVIGEGGTVLKPAPGRITESAPAPTSADVNGVPVAVSGSVVVVDGNTFTIPSEGVTTDINGDSVYIGPGTVSVAGGLFTWDAPSSAENTEVVVAGGDLLTAIGPSIVVIHSTSITYGPDESETSIVVDEDTITIGPSGITAHGITLGGPSVDPTDSNFEMVGGVTVTEIGSSIVVISGTSYTLGPDFDPVTTSIGGQNLTIGAESVIVSDMTLGGAANASRSVATIEPTGTWADDFPMETDDGSTDDGTEDEEDRAIKLLGSPSHVGLVGICLTLGVLVLV